MALEFLSDAPVGDAELVINLDLEGLHTLFRLLVTALEARREHSPLEGEEAGAMAGGGAFAFAKVSVRFVEPARPGCGRDRPAATAPR